MNCSTSPAIRRRTSHPGAETPDGEGVWVRPLSMWTETVPRDGRWVPRFTYLGETHPDSSSETPSERVFATPEVDG